MADLKKKNIEALKVGLKRARDLASNIIANSCADRVMSIVEAGEWCRQWMGFTGNAQLSIGCAVYDKDGILYDICSYEGMPPIIRPKLQLGESVYLETPYEGYPRRREGMAEIKWDTNTEALDAIFSLPMKDHIAGLRFAFPVEYRKWLAGIENKDNDPIRVMHQMASIDFIRL